MSLYIQCGNVDCNERACFRAAVNCRMMFDGKRGVKQMQMSLPIYFCAKCASMMDKHDVLSVSEHGVKAQKAYRLARNNRPLSIKASSLWFEPIDVAPTCCICGVVMVRQKGEWKCVNCGSIQPAE